MSEAHKHRKRDRLRELFHRSHSDDGKAAKSKDENKPNAKSEDKLKVSDTATGDKLSVYEAALQNLSSEDRTLLGNHGTLSECITSAELIRSTCYKAKIHWQFRGKTITLRDQTDKLLTALHTLKPVGEYVAGLDEAHFALPWAAISFLLDVALKNREQRQALLQGMERCLDCQARISVYEAQLSTTPAADNLKDSLVKLNTKILHFLLVAVRACQANILVKLAQPWWVVADIEHFDEECEGALAAIDRDASIFGLVTLQQALSSISLKVDDIAVKINLQDLKDAAVLSALAQGEGCLENTRVDLLESIKQWATSDERTFWLQGQAGSGKSTILDSVADMLPAQALVTASFCFKKNVSRQQDARYFWPTVLQQLVDKIPPLRPHVAEVAQASTLFSSKQYTELIETPLRDCGFPQSNICLVIDALDECELNIKPLLKSLHTTEMRVFVTSRPGVSLTMTEHRMDAIDPEADIALFIENELSVDPYTAKALAAKTTPSWVTASTICKYINEGDAVEKITRLVQSQAIADLVEFYDGILKEITRGMSAQGRLDFIEDFPKIIGPLTVLADPLDAESLAQLLGIRIAKVESVLNRLQSALHTEGPITPHHITFYECINQGEGPFHISKTAAGAIVGEACLRMLNNSIRQYVVLPRKPDALATIDFPSALRYACRYWSNHVVDEDAMFTFLASRLLSWLEAMCWMGHLWHAQQTLSTMSENAGDLLQVLIKDCQRFITQNYFAIEQWPLQIHTSAALFSSSSSTIAALLEEALIQNEHFSRLPRPPQTWERNSWQWPMQASHIAVSDDLKKLACLSTIGRLTILATDTRQELADFWRVLSPSTAHFLTFAANYQLLHLMVDDPSEQASMFYINMNTGESSTSLFDCQGSIRGASQTLHHLVMEDAGSLWLYNILIYGKPLQISADTSCRLAMAADYTAIVTSDIQVKVINHYDAKIVCSMDTAYTKIDLLAICDDFLAIAADGSDSIDLYQLKTLQKIRSVNVSSLPIWKRRHHSQLLHHKYFQPDAGVHFQTFHSTTYLILTDGQDIVSIDTETGVLFTYDVPANANRTLAVPVNENRFVCVDGSFLRHYEITELVDEPAKPETAFEAFFYDSVVTKGAARNVLALGTIDELSIWSDDLELVKSLPCHYNWSRILLSPDQRYLLGEGSRLEDSAGGRELLIWDLAQDTSTSTTAAADITRAAFSPCSQYITYYDQRMYTLLHIESSHSISLPAKLPEKLVFAQDGSSVIIFGEAIAAKDANPTKGDDEREYTATLFDLDGKVLSEKTGFTGTETTAVLDNHTVTLATSPQTPTDILSIEDYWLRVGSQNVIWLPPSQICNQEYVVFGRNIIVYKPSKGIMRFELREDVYQTNLKLLAKAETHTTAAVDSHT